MAARLGERGRNKILSVVLRCRSDLLRQSRCKIDALRLLLTANPKKNPS